MAEFDVEDCFLNRPIALVLPALNYWFTFDFRSRHGPSVLPSVKTGRQKTMSADHAHYTIGKSQQRWWRAAVEWEVAQNSLFEVVGEGGMLVLQQHKGLPIGGHLSA